MQKQEPLVDMLHSHNLVLFSPLSNLHQTVPLDLLAVRCHRAVVGVGNEVEVAVLGPAELVVGVYVVHVHLLHPAHYPQNSSYSYQVIWFYAKIVCEVDPGLHLRLHVPFQTLDFVIVVSQNRNRISPVSKHHPLLALIRSLNNYHPFALLELFLQILLQLVNQHAFEVGVEAHDSYDFVSGFVDSANYPLQFSADDLHQLIGPDVELHFDVFGLFLQKFARVFSWGVELEYLLGADGSLGTLNLIIGVACQDEPVLRNLDVLVMRELIVDEEIGLRQLLLGRPLLRFVGHSRMRQSLQNGVFQLHDLASREVALVELVDLTHAQVDELEADSGDQLHHRPLFVEFGYLPDVVLIGPHLDLDVLLDFEVVDGSVGVVEEVGVVFELDLLDGGESEPCEIIKRLPDLFCVFALDEDKAGKLLGHGQRRHDLAEEVIRVHSHVLRLLQYPRHQFRLMSLHAPHLVQVLLMPVLMAVQHLVLLFRVDLLHHVLVVRLDLLGRLAFEVLQDQLCCSLLTRLVEEFVVGFFLVQLVLPVGVEGGEFFARFGRGLVVDELFYFFVDLFAP